MRIFNYLLFIIFVLSSFSAFAQCNINGVTITTILPDPNSVAGNNFDTDQNGVAEALDEYIEICNKDLMNSVDISQWIVGDNDGNIVHTFPAGTMLAPGACLILVSNWQNTMIPPPPGVIDLDLNTPWINNDGDNVFIASENDMELCAVAFGDEPCDLIPGLPFIVNCVQWDDNSIDGCPLRLGMPDCNYVPVALPIELLYFEAVANNRSVALEWATSTEINNEGFIIEWSQDGISFDEIGRKTGAGNSTGIRNYSFDHTRVPVGDHFYRLIQVDFDGSMSYSDVKTTRINPSIDKISIVSNMVDDYLNIESPEGIPYQIGIYTSNGESVYLSSDVQGSQNIDLSTLNLGFYFVRVVQNNESSSFKIFKN